MALGHRRLSILDLTPNGRQPMVSACGRYVVTLNGEIYNFRQLRRELENHGHRFRGSSDTEVLLAAVAEWGVEEALRVFNGMFAFAIWDRSQRILHLARDRAGEKPLYYGRCGGSFMFASELKALRVHPSFAGEIDRSALCLYLRHGYIPSPYSIYRGIYKLPAGHHLAIGLDGSPPEPRPYWSARDAVESGIGHPFAGSGEEAIDELDRLLRESVALRMVADVPLGAFLSGGIDSSTVVALMQAQSAQPVRTFTIGFRDPRYNEADNARQVARHLGTEHTELFLDSRDALALIPRLPTLYDEPFADSSQLPTYLVSELARRRVTVSLSGDGGDELFAGYKLYRAGQHLWKATGWMPFGLRRMLGRSLRSVPGAALNAFSFCFPRAQSHYGNTGKLEDKVKKLALAVMIAEPELQHHALVSHHAFPHDLVVGAAEYPTAFTDPAGWLPLPNLVDRMMYLDLIGYLPDDILVKLDRASMSVGLESRVPFLDHRVIEFAWSLPLDLKMRNGQQKWVLRQVLGRYLPAEFLNRPKRGFAIPLADWLRGPLRNWGRDLLERSSLESDGYFDAAPVGALWREHLAGTHDWSQIAWNVLMFQAWLHGRDRASNPTTPAGRAPSGAHVEIAARWMGVESVQSGHA
jgi:asparagine synthase (glutamine-hydrolysing)